MSLMFKPLRRYADFQGRACRTEFWLFQLFIMILAMAFVAVLVTVTIMNPTEKGEEPPVAFTVAVLAAVVTYLALFIPRLALIIRRLHDSDNSGFWVLVSLIPGLSAVMLVFSLLPGTVGPNGHGPDPRGRGAPTTRQATMTLDSVA
ncbi:DUF805 domain-containing protein [Caulobacter sp. 17J65-9]|uniref:DUF805 domain-containing protein n=1 Tax=Caulobacter sp. 17J65-9 TaxID=2709382 RepID=UPI0013CC0788|nr:DUF805 domain-containing protein [Caulobacter sp. 17J65-9]NEX92996.1 DUF805 domain-containing protein [Caulobacter sp. 17J65-9]